MLARKVLSVLCAALGIAYLAQDLALALSVEVAPVWLILENVFLAFAYISLGTFRAIKRPELPLSALAGFNAGRMVDAILDSSGSSHLRAIRAALALLALAVVVLSWASVLGEQSGGEEPKREAEGSTDVGASGGTVNVGPVPAARRPVPTSGRRRNLRDLSGRRARRSRRELYP